jgi:hypothetical protein
LKPQSGADARQYAQIQKYSLWEGVDAKLHDSAARYLLERIYEMDENSMKLKSVFEALSVAAVVLSLIFVGLEVNESTRATRSATAAETTATIAEWYMSLGSDQQAS